MSGSRPTQVSLRETQVWTLGAISKSDVDASAASFIYAGPRLDAAARLDIYRHAYRARLHECLSSDYPVLASMLGELRFDALVDGYIVDHPSGSPNLNGYGRHFARFCKRDPGGVLRELAVLAAELATLEWSLVEVLHAELSPPLDVSGLLSSPSEQWQGARFVVSSAVRLLRFEYATNAHYQARVERGVEAEPAAHRASTTLVYRSGLKIWRMDLTPSMARVLCPLLDGQTLGTTFATLGESVASQSEAEELGRNLSVWFREWSAAGIFTKLIYE